jgi:Flp pilus assembly pilin Flp
MDRTGVLHQFTSWSRLTSVPRGEGGATAVEYALMVALIALVIVGAVIVLGNSTSDAMCGPVPALGGAEGDC